MIEGSERELHLAVDCTSLNDIGTLSEAFSNAKDPSSGYSEKYGCL
jgi:hypothetical protein